MLAGALSIAIGVALALGVHWVNRSALAEFSAAIAMVNGDAQAQLVGRSADFDEQVYATLTESSGIAAASPVIEFKALASVVGPTAPRAPLRTTESPGLTQSGSPQASQPIALRVLGIDPLRAAQVTPTLLPSLAEADRNDPAALFADDAVFLSRAAARALGIAPGEQIVIQTGAHQKNLRVAGSVEGADEGQLLAVLDIGNAQQYFGRLGKLSRIDLRFKENADAGSVRAAVEPTLPIQVLWSVPQAAGQRMSNLSRAYRVNLNVLALVALFTGAFIVQATLALRVARQQHEIALLGVLGAPRRFAAKRILIDALAIGALGSVTGVLGGMALASLLLAVTGGDLGGGYFDRRVIALAIDPLSVAAGLAGGLAIALMGAFSPMRAAQRIIPARALRARSTESVLDPSGRARWAAGLAAIALLLLAAPPIADLPLAAYASIAILLLAGVMLTGPLIGPCSRAVIQALERRAPPPTVWLALSRMAGAPGSAGSALGGVVASFALASAMAIMVTSFRVSVSDWLDQVLPADLYARLPASAAGEGFDASLQTRIRALPGASQVEFSRVGSILLDERRPAVALVARPLNSAGVAARLPLTGKTVAVPENQLGVWVSEPFADIYRVQPGDMLSLPIGNTPTPVRALVAGIWRDYARQHGAIAIDIDDYRRLTGDGAANEVAWWLADRSQTEAFIAQAQALSPLTDSMEFRDTGQLKSLSLKIFDRSFAITHVLEAIAIAVALFGVATSVAGEALARQREFGMLRHLGLTRKQIGQQFALEAALGTVVACLWGLVLGAVVAWVLVHRVNPQSFHWTMSMHWPASMLATSAFAMIMLAAVAARLSAREATGAAPVLAVRQDW